MIVHSGNSLDVLRSFPDESVQCAITSPPYWGLRDYGCEGQLGQESTPEEFVAHLVAVFREIRRVLRHDGCLWLNLGDNYASGGKGGGGAFMKMRGNGAGAWSHRAQKKGWRKPPEGYKEKDLVGIPWMAAFALRADGWYLRQEVIWSKPNPMPESVRSRCVKAHEHLFLLTKTKKYYFDHSAIQEPTIKGSAGKRNKRSVWTIPVASYKGAHFAVMPEKLVEPCVLAGTKAGDIVLDPFCGSGTVGVVALRHSRKFIGIELNPDYVRLAYNRMGVQDTLSPQTNAKE